MSKVHYLNSHLQKFREKPEIKIDLEDVEALAYYDVLVKEDKKTTKLFVKCFKNKETYKDLIRKLPDTVERLGLFYLTTVYWIAYTCHYHNDKFDEAMGHCLDSIDMDVPVLNSPHFCKKVYYYLNPIDEVKC